MASRTNYELVEVCIFCYLSDWHNFLNIFEGYLRDVCAYIKSVWLDFFVYEAYLIISFTENNLSFVHN